LAVGATNFTEVGHFVYLSRKLEKAIPEEVRGKWPEALDAWYESPHLAEIPAGESLGQLRERAMPAIGNMAEKHKGETIVVVGHTVINRIILLGVLGLGNEAFWHLRQEPCAINIIEAGDGGYILASMNDTCHLKGQSIPE
jgi:phosphoserine phosphatase